MLTPIEIGELFCTITIGSFLGDTLSLRKLQKISAVN